MYNNPWKPLDVAQQNFKTKSMSHLKGYIVSHRRYSHSPGKTEGLFGMNTVPVTHCLVPAKPTWTHKPCSQTMVLHMSTPMHHRAQLHTVYPKKYAHGFCFAVLCCGYTLTDFPISTRLTSLALWQSNYCPSAGKATLMNMDKYFMWNHYERLHNHNKAKHNKTVCIFLGIYCKCCLASVGPYCW